MSMWFYVQNGQQVGDFSLEKMRSLAEQGEIDRNTLVWKKGMHDWKPLTETELKNILPSDRPPPIPGATPPPIPQFPTTYQTLRKETESSTRTSSTTISREEKKRLLVAAKSRIWAHWLFWLVVPFGGFISNAKCPKKDKKTSNEILRMQAIAIFFNMIYWFTEIGLFVLLAIICLITGAIKTTKAIQEARKKVGIEDPIEAERELIAESRRV